MAEAVASTLAQMEQMQRSHLNQAKHQNNMGEMGTKEPKKKGKSTWALWKRFGAFKKKQNPAQEDNEEDNKDKLSPSPARSSCSTTPTQRCLPSPVNSSCSHSPALTTPPRGILVPAKQEGPTVEMMRSRIQELYNKVDEIEFSISELQDGYDGSLQAENGHLSKEIDKIRGLLMSLQDAQNKEKVYTDRRYDEVESDLDKMAATFQRIQKYFIEELNEKDSEIEKLKKDIACQNEALASLQSRFDKLIKLENMPKVKHDNN